MKISWVKVWQTIMELVKLPLDAIKVLLDWVGSMGRSVMCSVSKNMCAWILELAESNPIVKEYYATEYIPIPPLGYPISDEHINARKRMYTIAALGDYHLFVRLYAKKDVECGNRIVGYAAKGGNIDLLLLMIDKMVPHCILWEDYFAAGQGGNKKCIDMVLQFEHMNGHLAIASGAAVDGHIEVVRDMMHVLQTNKGINVMNIVNSAIESLEFGLDIIKMLVDEFKVHISYLAYGAVHSIKMNNMACLQYFTDKGAKPGLVSAGTYGNILALEWLIECGADDYVNAFNRACGFGHMKFVAHMMKKHVKEINVHVGFTKLGVKCRVEFMEICLKLSVGFDADLWFKETYHLDGGQEVCKWMADHLIISDVLRRVCEKWNE